MSYYRIEIENTRSENVFNKMRESGIHTVCSRNDTDVISTVIVESQIYNSDEIFQMLKMINDGHKCDIWQISEEQLNEYIKRPKLDNR